LGKKSAKHALLKGFEKETLRGEQACSKWVSINDDSASKKIINCANVTELTNIGKCLFKIRSNRRVWLVRKNSLLSYGGM
jgi:hypothetical protein